MISDHRITRRQFSSGLMAVGAASGAAPALGQNEQCVPIRIAETRRTKPYLFEPSLPQLERLREFQAAARKASRIHVPPTARTPNSVSLAAYQTTYRDQEGRGTCYAFAACAAMEAAYKRKYGVELHISEHYAFHINKCFELYPNYTTTKLQHENNTSFCGFQGASDIVGKLSVCALPDASSAPYLLQGQMEELRNAVPGWNPACDANVDSTQEQYDALEFAADHIPLIARHSARYLIADYKVLPEDPAVEDVEAVLAAGYEVLADVDGHCALLIGYDRTTRQWLVKNSWGEGGPGCVGYDDSLWRILGGTYIVDIAPPNAEPQKEACWLGRWLMDHDGSQDELVIRRTFDFHNPGQPTKLGNCYRGGKSFDVNGNVIDNGQGLHFWIADTEGRVPPGERRGQEFRLHLLHPLSLHWVAGHAWRNGTLYGVRFNRFRLEGRPPADFRPAAWNGMWRLVHGGGVATVMVRGVPAEPTVTYKPEESSVFPAMAQITPNAPHVLKFTVDLSPSDRREFLIACHTHRNDVFSGTMLREGRTHGVTALRHADF